MSSNQGEANLPSHFGIDPSHGQCETNDLPRQQPAPSQPMSSPTTPAQTNVPYTSGREPRPYSAMGSTTDASDYLPDKFAGLGAGSNLGSEPKSAAPKVPAPINTGLAGAGATTNSSPEMTELGMKHEGLDEFDSSDRGSKQRRKKKWWIIGIIAAVVVLGAAIGGGVGGGLAHKNKQTKYAAGYVCSGDNQCLSGSCAPNSANATFYCTGSLTLGERCVSDYDCTGLLVCQAGSRTCANDYGTPTTTGYSLGTAAQTSTNSKSRSVLIVTTSTPTSTTPVVVPASTPSVTSPTTTLFLPGSVAGTTTIGGGVYVTTVPATTTPTATSFFTGAVAGRTTLGQIVRITTVPANVSPTALLFVTGPTVGTTTSAGVIRVTQTSALRAESAIGGSQYGTPGQSCTGDGDCDFELGCAAGICSYILCRTDADCPYNSGVFCIFRDASYGGHCGYITCSTAQDCSSVLSSEGETYRASAAFCSSVLFTVTQTTNYCRAPVVTASTTAVTIPTGLRRKRTPGNVYV